MKAQIRFIVIAGLLLLGVLSNSSCCSPHNIIDSASPDHSFPAELDFTYYRGNNQDLRDLGMTDEQLRNHYVRHGINAGRRGSPFCDRGQFVKLADFNQKTTLELSPWASPVAIGPKVKYSDVFDQATLIKRAQGDPSFSPERIAKIPYVDYVLPNGDLSTIREQFENVVSSHSIEHTTDLVTHLINVSKLLIEKGCYFVLCPDKRYCFDHFKPESTAIDILEAHYAQTRTVHSDRQIMTQRLFSTHNDATRHWNGDHGPKPQPTIGDINKTIALMNLHKKNDLYFDAHEWQFTPSSFKEIILYLYNAGITDMYPVRVYQTPKNTFEFGAILQKRTRK
jgi:hypothetical protein